MHGVKRGKGEIAEEALDDSDKDTKRKTRNLSEKKRRDQFNLLLNELCSMVASGERKMDKSAVLKTSIAFLRRHNEAEARSRVHDVEDDWKPTFLTNGEFAHLVLESTGCFVVAFNLTTGKILYVTDAVGLLGYVAPGGDFYQTLLEEEGVSLRDSLASIADRDVRLSFTCHVISGEEAGGDVEAVSFVGHSRSLEPVSTSNNMLFVGTGRLLTPQLPRDTFASDNACDEFTSRHSLEWKFLFLDHRASPLIGYLPFELLGTSGYDYYHVDDLDKLAKCHEALMLKSEGTTCCYRFLTKGQQWIWLQTRFYITYNQWNTKPEFVVCLHRVVRRGEVVRSREEAAGWTSSTPPHLKQTEGDASFDQAEQHAADLQRKHAQLQASIGQQQAELMMISEQLLMARLGLLATPQATTLGFGTVSSSTSSTLDASPGSLYRGDESGSQSKYL